MVPGLILAAGWSSRMGRPKALLPVGPHGPTFVARIIQTLRDGGVVDALVVGRPDDSELRGEVDRIGPPARFVENHHASAGQLSSVVAGLNIADRPATQGILVTPIDLPLISSRTVAALLAAFASTRAPIVRATFEGRHGHPVIFSRALFDELRRADPAIGARAVLRAHDSSILNVEVEDAGVIADINRPEDYARWFGRSLIP